MDALSHYTRSIRVTIGDVSKIHLPGPSVKASPSDIFFWILNLINFTLFFSSIASSGHFLHHSLLCLLLLWFVNRMDCREALGFIGPTVTVSKFKGGGVVNNRNTSAGFYNCGPPVIHSSPLNSQFAANYCVYVPIHLRHVAISLHFNISNTLALDSNNLCLFHSHFLR